MQNTKLFLFGFLFLFQVLANAEDLQKVRWLAKDQAPTDLAQIVARLSTELHTSLNAADFQVAEQSELKDMNFAFYQQSVAGVPVKNAGVRLWTSSADHALIQMIAFIQDPNSKQMLAARAQLKTLEAAPVQVGFQEVQKIAGSELKTIRNFKTETAWVNGEVVQIVMVYGKDRSIEYHLNPQTHAVLSQKLRLYPREDVKPSRQNQDDEFSMQGKVYQVSEEYDTPYGRQASGATPQPTELKYLKKQYRASKDNWVGLLPQSQFDSGMEDDVKAATPEGRAQGYWSAQSIKDMIEQTTQVLPLQQNEYANVNGAHFNGRYVQVLIHPDAFSKFPVTTFTPFYSTSANSNWVQNGYAWNLVLSPASYGRPVFSAQDLLSREAHYEVQHNTVGLINEGFDEMQVYWAVTTWFEMMHDAGFLDKELSTRPMQAYLFYPGIDYQDNAFYDSDTINFSTYTERNCDEARNLGTIWHELGHGLMDRLQGASGFDNGGLSEGTADFGAEMVLRGFYKDQVPAAMNQRRIVNRIGFNLTNEGHDDGEAYGGTMKDVMDAKIARDGFAGYAKTTDLTMDAMRLTRHMPNISLQDWYEALVLSDQLGKAGLRSSGEFGSDLQTAFANRNYVYQQAPAAAMHLMNEGGEITDSSAGSRSHPIQIRVPPAQEHDFTLDLTVPSANPAYTYPMTVVVAYKDTNALQGSAKFKTEEDQIFTLNSATDTIHIPLTVLGCDYVNTEKNSCTDFVNVQVFAKGGTTPFAKKRFYIDNTVQ